MGIFYAFFWQVGYSFRLVDDFSFFACNLKMNKSAEEDAKRKKCLILLWYLFLSPLVAKSHHYSVAFPLNGLSFFPLV